MAGKVKKIRKGLGLMLLCVLLFFHYAMPALAGSIVDKDNMGLVQDEEGDWVNPYEKLYGNNADIEGRYEGGGELDEEEPRQGIGGSLGEIFGEFLAHIGDFLNFLFSGNGLNLSIDGIVYGRLDEDFNMVMDIAHFGLEENNPYGILGASLYYFLKKMVYILIPVLVLFKLITHLFKNSKKSREELKATLEQVVFFFIMVELAPYLVELYIYLRDVAMRITSEGLQSVVALIDYGYSYEHNGQTVTEAVEVLSMDGLYSMFYNHYLETESFVDGAMVLAVSAAGLFYLWDYIKIAALLSVVFGLLPLILIWRFFKPGIFSDWADIIFPALLTPFIDMLFLMVPAFVSSVFAQVFGGVESSSYRQDFVLAIVMLACIWSARGLRDRVIELFGFKRMRKDNSMFALLAMMARNGRRTGGGGEGGRNALPASSPAAESGKQAAQQKDISESMHEADRRIEQSDVVKGSETIHPAQAGGKTATEEFLEQEAGAPEEASGVDAEEISDTGVSTEDSERAVEGNAEPAESFSDIAVEGDAEAVPDIAENTEIMPAMTAVDEKVQGEAAETLTESLPQSSDLKPVKAEETVSADSGADGAVTEADRTKPYSYDGHEQSVSVPDKMASEVYREVTKKGENGEASMYDKFSARDQKRFDNLARKDVLEAEIAKQKGYMEKAGYNPDTFQETYEKENARNLALRQQKEQYRIQRDSYTDKDSVEYRNADTLYKQTGNSLRESNEYMTDLSRAYEAAQKAEFYGKHLEHCRSVEASYAHNSEMAGMSGRSYTSAGDFKYAKEIENIKKRHVDYRNFDSGRFDTILSPQEKSDFYRERERNQKREEILRVVGSATATTVRVAAGATLGTVGAVAMAAGGPTSMAAGAMVGSGIPSAVTDASSKIADGVRSGARAGGYVYEEIKERIHKADAEGQVIRKEPVQPAESRQKPAKGPAKVSEYKERKQEEAYAKAKEKELNEGADRGNAKYEEEQKNKTP